MTAQLAPTPIFKAFDNNGSPLALGFLTTYAAGTATKIPSYVDASQTTQNTNPIQLNFRGECALWLDPALTYKFALTDQSGNVIPGWPVDNIPGNGATTSGSLIPTADNAFSLGSPSFSWANIYVGANHAPVLDTVSGNIGYYARTAAEVAAGASPVNFSYPSGHVYRYGTNSLPGTTDMTAAINTAANVARAAGTGTNVTVQIPQDSVLLVTASLNFTNCSVVGFGCSCGVSLGIKASSAVFDVITSTGGTILDNLYVDGGWDQVTTGLAGDILSLKAVSPAHPYVNSFSNCTFVNAKQRGIYIERGGYTSLFHMRVLTCGLHALECFGSNTDPTTSIRDYGGSQYGGTPNGYSIKLTNCTAMVFQGTICEATNGISLNGATFNNAITFDGIYQEFNPTPSFTAKIDNGSGGAGNILTITAPATLAGIGVGSVPSAGGGAVVINQLTGNPGSTGTYTLSGSAQTVASTAMTAPPIPFIDNAGGSALTIRGSYFATGSFPFSPAAPVFQNWLNVYFQGNKFVNGNQGPIPFGGRIQTSSINAFVNTTSDITSGQLTLAPGAYRLWGAVQTIINSGGGTITQLACQITTNASASPPANGVGAGFVEGAAQTSSFGAQQDARINCFTMVQVLVSTIYYLRVHVTLSGTITVGCDGFLRAELIE